MERYGEVWGGVCEGGRRQGERSVFVRVLGADQQEVREHVQWLGRREIGDSLKTSMDL